MRMKRSEKYVLNLATNIIGKNLLTTLLEMRKEKVIRKGIIRQIFTHDVKVVVSKMSPETLGVICALGVNLGRDEMIVTSGSNPRFAIFLDTADSGLVLLQKITVATILSAIDRLINGGKPHFNESWSQSDLVRHMSSGESSEKQRLKKVLGW